ncbi:glycine betaine ABC transporter substrate-binding protein [Microlunatus sp. Gsoil 973]|uniref:glycine betaine ABC transporter substrate-binding protein n=1 Tax=Microlunatus sp. Gsoil 973 TaxID=2672569 RepID=UPI0012B4CC2A|nr:glycine betaine ABC transporter substrate-binding protein [Microlunatus sp. Gsoil 973]QGN34520.1 glycine/betaine ABC transporter substrate-binding protein [Microlunatus sp. Gsoil 973]
MTDPTTATTKNSADRRPLSSRLSGIGAGLLTLVILASVSACGLGTSGGYIPSARLAGRLADVPRMDGAHISVGSKNFTEQLVLAKMVEILLKSAGATVEDLTNIPGSASARQAQLAGQVDVEWEYTGTAWLTYMAQPKPIRDPHDQYVAVRDKDLKENQLVWTDPSPMNDTYGLAATEATAKKLGVEKLSDLKKLPVKQRTFCLEDEFASRSDGFQPMLKAYGLKYGVDVPKKNVKIFDAGAIYSATAKGVCNFGEVYTTDGRIAALHLSVLADDNRFFPVYNGCAVWRQEVVEKYPQTRKLVDPLAAKLTDKTMTELNGKVDVGGQTPTKVAEDWLRSEGFIR